MLHPCIFLLCAITALAVGESIIAVKLTDNTTPRVLFWFQFFLSLCLFEKYIRPVKLTSVLFSQNPWVYTKFNGCLRRPVLAMALTNKQAQASS